MAKIQEGKIANSMLPDYHFTKCPYSPKSIDNPQACEMCSLLFEDYRRCPSYIIHITTADFQKVGRQVILALEEQVEKSKLVDAQEDATRTGKFTLEGLRGG